jgi:isocitrate dehydrogenase
MMLEELGWGKAGEHIVRGIEGALAAGTVTYDLARQMPGATTVPSSGFADAIIRHMGS